MQTWCYVKRKGGAVWENCAMRPCKHIPDNGDADNDGDRGKINKMNFICFNTFSLLSYLMNLIDFNHIVNSVPYRLVIAQTLGL